MLKLITTFCALFALAYGQVAYYQQPVQYRPVQYVTSTPSPYRAIVSTAAPPIVRPTSAPVYRTAYSGNEATAAILRQAQDQSPDSTQYQYGYETDNGITVQEQGNVKALTRDGEGIMEAVGSFSYTSPEGIPITVQYVANENGFQPQGDHLPTPPPIPEAILRSLQYIAANPPSTVESARRFIK